MGLTCQALSVLSHVASFSPRFGRSSAHVEAAWGSRALISAACRPPPLVSHVGTWLPRRLVVWRP